MKDPPIHCDLLIVSSLSALSICTFAYLLHETLGTLVHESMAEVKVTLEVGNDAVAVITIFNPPVNALAIPIIAVLKKKFEEVAGRNDVTAIVLSGNGGRFFGGFDINVFEKVHKRWFLYVSRRRAYNDPLRAKYNAKMAGMNTPIAKPKGSKKLKDWESH